MVMLHMQVEDRLSNIIPLSGRAQAIDWPGPALDFVQRSTAKSAMQLSHNTMMKSNYNCLFTTAHFIECSMSWQKRRVRMYAVIVLHAGMHWCYAQICTQYHEIIFCNRQSKRPTTFLIWKQFGWELYDHTYRALWLYIQDGATLK